ncbi:hypothetical protein RA876_19575 (plasmid) [Rhodoferax antarcticus]|nr:hypothetical protein RA876_19575 [Rhodoferax antarcticus]
MLSEDARMTATAIGTKVHRSRVAVQSRIDALVKSGEITGFRVTLKRQPIPALFEIRLKPKSRCEDVLPKFRARYRIDKAWSVTGVTDLFIWTETEDSHELHLMRSFLTEQAEVASVFTHPILRTYE